MSFSRSRTNQTASGNRLADLETLRAIALLSMVLAASTAQGAWVIEPSANLETRYDDNIRLNSQNEESGTVSTLGVQARLRQVSEVSEVSVMTGATLSKYSGVESFEDDQRESLFLEGRAQRQFERSGVRLRTSIRRQDLQRYSRVLEPVGLVEEETVLEDDSALFDETSVEDDLITGVDVNWGVVQRLVRRDLVRIDPSFSYSINPRTSITLGYGFSDLSYEDSAQTSSLQDSRSHRLSLQLQRRLSERNTAALVIERSRFEPELNLETDSTSAVASWVRQLSQRTSISLGAGLRKTETDEFNDKGALFSARLDRRTDSGAMYAIAERSLNPSAFGNQVESDRITLGFRDNINERISWRFNMRAFRTETISNRQQDRVRDFLQIEPSLQWAFSEKWQARLSYRYTWIDRDIDVDTVIGNSVSFSLEYVPPRRF